MTILEDLKSGRLVVVPRRAPPEMVDAGRKAIADERQRVGLQYADTLSILAYNAMITASPDHTAGLIALVEGMERERAEGEQSDRMVKISALIANLTAVRDRYGDTCVYIRRGGMSWGAVALNREADDKKHGVFDLQAQHDRDMHAMADRVERLTQDRKAAEAERDALRKALAKVRDRFFPQDQGERERDELWDEVNRALTEKHNG